MEIALSFFPVLLFMAFLFQLDSFKLVRIKVVILCLLCGILSTAAGYFLNTFLGKWFAADFQFLSRYIAPFTEEILKSLLVFYLISKKKIGFAIDAAIYGFAIGAGFSLAENIWYLLNTPPEFNALIWIIRGFGTAVMHGGCTALFAVLLISGVNRPGKRLPAAVSGLLLAIFLHGAFNAFLFSPIVQTIFISISLPVVMAIVFRQSNEKLQRWLEIEFFSEIELLNMIRKGEFTTTKAGQFLISLKDRFAPEIIVDMYCYISLYMELSIKAKRNLMLRENGFPVIMEEDIQSKLAELSQLRKQIGKVGELSLAPLIRLNYRNLWKLTQLGNNQ